MRDYLRRLIFPRTMHVSLGHEIRRELPFLLVIALIVLAFEQLHVLRGFETYALDAFLMLNSPPPTSDIVIVTIDEEDYQHYFHGTSPLDPDEIAKIIQRVAEANPRVIAVDLDTTDTRPGQGALPANVVWAREGHVAKEVDKPPPTLFSQEDSIVPDPFMAGIFDDKTVNNRVETTPRSGLVVFPRDYDGVVRRYQPSFPLSDGHSNSHSETSEKWIDTLPRVVALCYEAATRPPRTAMESEIVQRIIRNRDRSNEVVMNFASDGDHYTHIPLHALYDWQNWKDRSPARDAVVLIGGTYHAARDEYATPVGTRFGVELQAMAVDIELYGGGIKELHWMLAAALDILAGIVFIYLNWRFPEGRGAWISLVAIFVLPMFISYLMFRTVAYWLNSVAVLTGLWIHLLWGRSHELRSLRAEVAVHRARQQSGGEKTGVGPHA